ncbi:MAG: helix-turn-helix domain-containing protein [Acidimicrobiales bacterium]
MVPWSSPGDILRWWRTDVLGSSQQQVASRLSVKPTALSNWENGARAMSIDPNLVDAALDGNGVLGGLLWAFGTPKGLDANTLWTKVFPGDPTPVWLWIRSDAPSLHVLAEWGIARVAFEVEMPPNGVFLTVASSVAEAPVLVQLSEPAWADFGRGDLPDEIPGAMILPAIEHASRSEDTGTFHELFFRNLGDRFSRSRSRQLAGLNRAAPRSLAGFFNRFGSNNDRSAHVPRSSECSERVPWPQRSGTSDAETRARFATLRQARQLSLVDAIGRLAELADIEISKDTLRRFETGVGEPHDRLLPAALDQMLGADGHLAVLELRADEGSGAVRVPPYWFGPMWFEFSGPDREVTVTLQWGDWSRNITGRLPLRLAYHHSAGDQPLRVTAAPDIAWRVGLGRRSGATDINHGWSPTSVDTVRRAITETEDVILTSLERSASGWSLKSTAGESTAGESTDDKTTEEDESED